jgi:tryptophanyl-tRNA synthetase
MHLGNYLGFIKNSINLMSQGSSEVFLFIADLHAITVPQDPNALRKSVIEVAALYQACGLDAEKCNLFVQSQVPAHAELGWILGCYTSLGALNRMTQFKEKSEKYKKENASLGLYAYPVLMAADILLYQATFVPVGDDQKQHIEIARDIALSFNGKTSTNFFKLPQEVMVGSSKRIMSLRNGTKKMSKSDESDYSRINLLDSSDEIRSKITKAKTDSLAGVSYDPVNRPEISNLINIYAGLSELAVPDIVQKYSGASCSQFKTALSDLAIEKLAPIKVRFEALMNNQDHIHQVLSRGKHAAARVADATLSQVKKLIGLCL